MFQNWQCDPESSEYIGGREAVASLPAGYYSLKTDTFDTRPVAKRHDVRADDIVAFQAGPARAVLEEVRIFWAAGLRYAGLGITHKRGILLHGQHGCGKSAIVNLVIAATTSHNGIVFDVEPDELAEFTKALPWFRQIEGARPVVVLLEDLDEYCSRNEEELLDVMDGPGSIGQNILFLATTNNLDEIPARIRNRPSRIDMLVEVGLPDDALREEYLGFVLGKVKVPSEARRLASEWAARTAGFSLAQLKELCIGAVVYGREFETTRARLARGIV